MFGVDEVTLTPGDLEGNYIAILIAAHILPDDIPTPQDLKDVEEDILNKIQSFTLEVALESFTTLVKEGTFKSAVLLYYLAEQHGQDHFELSGKNRAFIRDYYPPDLVREALENEHTKHTTIRRLLSPGSVSVRISRANRF